MKSPFRRAKFSFALIILLSIIILTTACGSSGNKPPVISSLAADNMYVYPLGTSEIQCIASDPEADNMSFRWSCTDGSFRGSGPIVVWKAPNKYGDYHIMVVAKDENGGSTQSSLTISVVVNQNEQEPCCQ